jgi:hypothetical protein
MLSSLVGLEPPEPLPRPSLELVCGWLTSRKYQTWMGLMSIVQLKALTEQTNKTGSRDWLTEKGAEDLLGLICSKLEADSLR